MKAKSGPQKPSRCTVWLQEWSGVDEQTGYARGGAVSHTLLIRQTLLLQSCKIQMETASEQPTELPLCSRIIGLGLTMSKSIMATFSTGHCGQTYSSTAKPLD